ncbi:MAG: hypothetical protein Q7T29_11710 [Gallionella sp.]|nr:hypothetical protein [Gallionella sp.]
MTLRQKPDDFCGNFYFGAFPLHRRQPIGVIKQLDKNGIVQAGKPHFSGKQPINKKPKPASRIQARQVDNYSLRAPENKTGEHQLLLRNIPFLRGIGGIA